MKKFGIVLVVLIFLLATFYGWLLKTVYEE